MTRDSIRRLCLLDLRPDMLDRFDRRQQVSRVYRKRDGAWYILDLHYLDDWTPSYRREVYEADFVSVLRRDGAVFALLDSQGQVLAFSSLEPEFFGSRGQYLHLTMLHVTAPLRGRGLGRELFLLAAGEARDRGAEKMYVSANSSVDSTDFYLRMGCVDAKEIHAGIAREEPQDRPMEYALRLLP